MEGVGGMAGKHTLSDKQTDRQTDGRKIQEDQVVQRQTDRKKCQNYKNYLKKKIGTAMNR